MVGMQVLDKLYRYLPNGKKRGNGGYAGAGQAP